MDVVCVSFVTPFFGSRKAEKAAAQMGIPLLVRDVSDVHLEIVKNPRYGYGKNMNPCIDCHALMFRLAGEIMEEVGADFLFSGEVLGQRPMSQNASALNAVAKHSGLKGAILRPLSARLLPLTPMEEQGLVDRQGLLDIQGRSRKRQEGLAAQWGLTDYPSSGGGCLLTEKSFSGRLRDLFERHPGATVTDVRLLKVGRQFRLSPEAKLIVGRNKEDNESLRALARPLDVLIRCEGFSGPLGLVSGTAREGELATAAALVASYGKGQREEQVETRLEQGDRVWTLTVSPLDRQHAQSLAVA